MTMHTYIGVFFFLFFPVFYCFYILMFIVWFACLLGLIERARLVFCLLTNTNGRSCVTTLASRTFGSLALSLGHPTRRACGPVLLLSYKASREGRVTSR